MNPYRSSIIALLLLAAALAVLSQLPVIVSVPVLLLWPFVSVGQPVIDGHARLAVGSLLVLFSGWRLAVLLPGYLGRADLVAYGQFMMEARFLVILVLFIVSLVLCYAGARSLYKLRASRNSQKDTCQVQQ